MATKKTSRSKSEAGSASKSRTAGAQAKTTRSRKAPAKKTASKKTGSKAAKTAAPGKTGRKRTGASSTSEPVAPFSAITVEREIGGRMLTLETGRMAKQADGSCVARYGDTMVLATAQSAKGRDDIDFLPLTVDYREKTAAGGTIPGGFFKREGRPSTKEILTCRIIDRTIRPLFPTGFRKEVQVLSQTLSSDKENDPDMVAAIASFACLALSSIPHNPVLGIARIGLRDDKLLVNPTWSVLQSEENRLNLIVAAHDEAVVMVEGGAKEVGETVMLEALELGHKIASEVASLIEELVAKAGKPKSEWEPPQRDEKLVSAIEKKFGKALKAAPITPGSKSDRGAAIKAVKEEVVAAFPAPNGSTETEAKRHEKFVGSVCYDLVKLGERESILKGKRSDGRDGKKIRPITIDIGVMPRTHGSVLFTRGETQALGIATLGGVEDQQIIDGLMPQPRKRFLLHYAFPPFSVGEVRRQFGPGRREIGHGALAERSLECVLPDREDFPYTIRITSEILESNGSSSMATVCAGTLAMMDAGVKIKQPVAGIAMGLVMDGRKYTILSDILGSEDGCGDMDFKVAGTGRGINALQMDIKCDGLTREILAEALEQAREGRMHILREMLKVLRTPRQELSPNAPRLESLKIPVEKIGLVIGPAGRNIRQMQEDYEVKISVEDGGLCTITGVDHAKVDACLEHLSAMTAEVEVGAEYEGTVTAIKEFGAFIEILPSQEGLCHVSELSNEFIRSVTDVVRIGDKVKVKVIGIDDFGKVKLSRKALLEGGGDGPGRGDDRRERKDRDDGARRPGRDRDDRDESARRPRRDRDDEKGPRRDREESGGRPRRDRDEDRGPRRDREESSGRPRRDRDEDRGPRRDRDDDSRRPRRDRDDRDERRPRRDRDEEKRPRRDRDDEKRPRRDRDDEKAPRRDRDDEKAPRRDRDDEKRPRRDRDDEKAPRRDRDDRGSRRRNDDSERPGRSRRGRRDEAEEGLVEDPPVFDEVEVVEAEIVDEGPEEELTAAATVGELEDPDTFLGGDREDSESAPPRRRPRRPRRRRD